MKATALFSGLCILAHTVAAFQPPHPCLAYPSKVSKLRNCMTASSFCSSYLGGTASFTRTSTTTTTVPSSSPDPTSTLTMTICETTFLRYVTVTAETPVFVPGNRAVVLTTTAAPTCTEAPEAVYDRAMVASSSCGIFQTADSTAISGACNCILASSTTTTSTVTSGTVSTTTVTDPTITLPTGTVTFTIISTFADRDVYTVCTTA